RVDLEIAQHARPAQVEVAMTQPHRLVDLDPIVDRKHGGLGHVEDLDGAVLHLDLARRQLLVLVARGTAVHRPGDAHDVLRSDVVRAVDHALQDASSVAHVAEREMLAVLATPVDPSADRNLLSFVLGPQLAGPMTPHAHEIRFLMWSTTSARATASCSP